MAIHLVCDAIAIVVGFRSEYLELAEPLRLYEHPLAIRAEHPAGDDGEGRGNGDGICLCWIASAGTLASSPRSEEVPTVIKYLDAAFEHIVVPLHDVNAVQSQGGGILQGKRVRAGRGRHSDGNGRVFELARQLAV